MKYKYKCILDAVNAVNQYCTFNKGKQMYEC